MFRVFAFRFKSGSLKVATDSRCSCAEASSNPVEIGKHQANYSMDSTCTLVLMEGLRHGRVAAQPSSGPAGATPRQCESSPCKSKRRVLWSRVKGEGRAFASSGPSLPVQKPALLPGPRGPNGHYGITMALSVSRSEFAGSTVSALSFRLCKIPRCSTL